MLFSHPAAPIEITLSQDCEQQTNEYREDHIVVIPFFWEFTELFEAPPCYLSAVFDFARNIESSTKTTSLLTKALFFSEF